MPSRADAHEVRRRSSEPKPVAQTPRSSRLQRRRPIEEELRKTQQGQPQCVLRRSDMPSQREKVAHRNQIYGCPHVDDVRESDRNEPKRKELLRIINALLASHEPQGRTFTQVG